MLRSYDFSNMDNLRLGLSVVLHYRYLNIAMNWLINHKTQISHTAFNSCQNIYPYLTLRHIKNIQLKQFNTITHSIRKYDSGHIWFCFLMIWILNLVFSSPLFTRTFAIDFCSSPVHPSVNFFCVLLF